MKLEHTPTASQNIIGAPKMKNNIHVNDLKYSLFMSNEVTQYFSC